MYFQVKSARCVASIGINIIHNYHVKCWLLYVANESSKPHQLAVKIDDTIYD